MKSDFKSSKNKRGINFRKSVFSICLPILKEYPEYKIFLDWDKIVGSYMSSVCRPCKLNKEEKTLWLSTKYGAVLDVQYSEKSILDKLNTYLGNDFFEKVKIIQEKNNHKKVEKNNNIFTKIVFNIGDTGVEEQLVKLWNNIENK